MTIEGFAALVATVRVNKHKDYLVDSDLQLSSIDCSRSRFAPAASWVLFWNGKEPELCIVPELFIVPEEMIHRSKLRTRSDVIRITGCDAIAELFEMEPTLEIDPAILL